MVKKDDFGNDSLEWVERLERSERREYCLCLYARRGCVGIKSLWRGVVLLSFSVETRMWLI